MNISWMRSWQLSLLLFLALLASIGLHVARRLTVDLVQVVTLERVDLPLGAEIRVDFDAPMATPEPIDRALASETVSLSPAVPVEAHFVTPRRLVLLPMRPLTPFTTYRVRFGSALASKDGRPVASEGGAPLAFASSTFALERPPYPSIDDAGRARVELHFTGDVAEDALRTHARVRDAQGADHPFELSGAGGCWTLTLATVPGPGARLELAAGLPPRIGSNPLAVDVRRDLAWSTELVLQDVQVDAHGPPSTVRLRFSHPLADQDLRGFVTVAPSPEGLVARLADGDVVLRGAFAADAVYAVTVKAGVLGTTKLRLAKDARRIVRIEPPAPSLAFAREGTVLSTAAVPELEITGVATPEVVFEARRVYADNLVPLALRWTDAETLAGPTITRRIPIDAPPHERWTRRLDLAALLGERPRGVWRLEISDPRLRWRHESTTLSVTDLAPLVRLRPEGLVVLVTRLSDGAPAGGAKVVAWTSARQPAVSGTTDAAGLFLARGFASPVAVVTVETPDDLAYVSLDEHAVAHASKDVEGREAVRGPEAWVRAERGLVRPGETARLDAIVRTPIGAAPAEGLPVAWTISTPDGRVWRRIDRRTGPTGLLDLDVAIPTDAPTGSYAVGLSTPGVRSDLGRTAFRVEAFVPDRLEASVALPAGDLALGARVRASVEAHLLSGEPAEGRTVRLVARYAPVLDAPVEGFRFGDPEALPRAFDAPLLEAKLDAKGRAEIEVALPAPSPSGASLGAAFELEVIDVSGRASHASTVRVAKPTLPRLGLARPDEVGSDIRVALVGAGVADATATLERLVWKGGYVVRGDRVEWRADVVAEPVAKVDVAVRDGRGTAAFVTTEDGAFRVSVRAPGCAPASLRFDRWEGRARAASVADGAPRLLLSTDAPSAGPGTTVGVSCDAPFAGRGLLTLEGLGVLEVKTVDVTAGPQRFEIGVPADAPATVHATLSLVRAASAARGGPVRLVGAIPVRLERPARRVGLRLDAPAEVEPMRPLVVTVHTDVPTEVRLHLVDVGVLKLSNHPDPDPASFFAAVRRLDTRLADAYVHLLAGVRWAEKDAEPGGDEDAPHALGVRLDPTARATIETVALASSRVLVDGTAEVTLDVPDYEGRLRLVAVAASREGTGAAARDVVVRGPVSVAVHVPRAVSPGDEFTVGLEVRGDRVETHVDLDGLERIGDGPELRVRALDRLGVASVAVTARDAAGHERVRTSRLSVRPPAPLSTTYEVRTIEAGRQVVALPADLLPASRRARVTVGSGPAVAFLPALERLQEYPYGCIEQTTSRAFPLLAWGELARLANPEGADPVGGAPSDLVDTAIDRILSMQTSSGGFAYWPGLAEAQPFGSVYGAHFLVEAARLGRDVPKDRLAAALDHLERELKEGKAGAYAAYVLTLAGRATGPWLEVLADREEDGESRSRLAAAFLRRGDATRARALLADASDPWVTTPRATGGDLASPVRAAAILLEALEDVNPGDPRVAPLADRLARAARDARTFTTQENAAALLALARHLSREAREARDLAGRLELGGRTVDFVGAAGASLEIGPADPWTCVVDASRPTTLVLRTDGVPTKADGAPVARGMALRRALAGGPGPWRQGRLYAMTLEGEAPAGSEHLLVTDVLPGGFEIESTTPGEHDLDAERVEARDDRVLFFREAPASSVTFRRTYLVRAVTPGRFTWPAASAELLYDPSVGARTARGAVVEIVR